jgi:hypothetical protein
MPNRAEKNADPAPAVLPAASPEPAIRSALPANAPTLSDPIAPRPREIGGPTGPEPTRYGDWEKKGRCIDF